MTYDVIITCFMLKPKPRELEFRMMAQIKAWCLENKRNIPEKFSHTHLMQIHVMNHVMNHDCFEKYLDSEKKRYFFQNQKIGCQVRGEATLSLSYTIFSKKLI